MCIKKSQEPPKYALPTNDTRHIFPIKDGPVTKHAIAKNGRVFGLNFHM